MRSFLILLLLTSISATGYVRAQDVPRDPVTVERLDAQHWRVTVRNAEPSVLHDRLGGGEVSRIRIPGYVEEFRPGQPVLPFAALQFGLPQDGTLQLRVLSMEEESFSAGLRPLTPETGETDPAVTAPAQTESGAAFVREGLRIGTVLLRPARYDASAKRVTWLRSMTLDVRLEGTPGGVPARHPELYAGLQNAGDALQWCAPVPLARRASSPFRAGEQLLKIRTSATGMHRIRTEDFTAAGVDPALIDAATLRLTLMGIEQPVEVRDGGDGSLDPGDDLIFHAVRNEGEDGRFYDEWMTDNVYLLQWGGDAGLRFGEENVAPAAHPGATPVTALPLLTHLEEEHDYHRGDFEYSDMPFTRKVPGEDWIWGYLLKKDSISTAFSLNAPATATARMLVRVRGSSRDTSLMRVTLNGTVLGETRVPSRDVVAAEYDVPAGLLRGEGNRLTVLSVGLVQCPPENPTCSIERFYLDYAELRYASGLSTSAGAVDLDPAARYPGAERPATALVDMPDFSSRFAGVNLRTGARLTGMETGGGRVRMALDSSGRYHLYDPAAVLSPVSVTAVTIQGYAESGQQADYLVVTHRNFRAQAERLASYRQQADGYVTLVADVEDLYNEFNFGHKDPVAIRRFTENAWRSWQAPAPRFLTLIGDASWDARQVTPSASKVDFVPSYGNPVSDNYYVHFTPGEHDPYPYMAVGRIPAETPASADAVIDKIIAYESAPPQPWDNRYLFSVGGENPFEQAILKGFAESLIESHTTPNCIEPRLITKKTLDLVSYDDLDTLISEVNRGVSWFFFAGHGGTRVIDVGIERPDIFDNVDKYLFFVTMSCNTAHFAEPFETGLNERFVNSPQNGAVVAYGTSGLGEINYDFYVSDGMFRALLDSSVRNYGELSLLGKRNLLRVYSGLPPVAVHTVNQLCILGDPATRVPLARTPELAVQAEEIRTEPSIVSEQTRTQIFTRLRNYGLCMSDSVDVVLTVTRGETPVFTERRRVAPWAIDTLEMAWEYDFAGVDGPVDITVEVDAAYEVIERDESNNVATAQINVLPRGLTQIFPLDRAALTRSGEAYEFLVANPTFLPDAALNPRVELEYAADAQFSTGRQLLSLDPGPVYTAFAVDRPQAEGVYYWRARIVTDDGPERWSATRSFTVTGEAVQDERWQQSDDAQFAATETDALEFTGNGGVGLGDRRLPLEAVSGGFNGPIKHATINVGDARFYAANRGASRGFNVAVVEPVFGRITDSLTFDTYSGREEAARMIAFLQSVPDDHTLLLGIEDDANGFPPSSIDGTNITPELRAELKRFGATVIDSVGYRDSYVLIGRRAAPAEATDQHFVLGTAAVRDTITVRATRGSFTTPVIGPVTALQSLRWDGATGAAGSGVDMQLIALTASGDSVVASYADVAPGTDIALPAALPSAFLRLRGTLRDPQGAGSPLVRSLRLGYTSRFPETGITSQVVSSDADSVEEGQHITVHAAVYNAGRRAAEGWQLRLAVPGSQVAVTQALPSLAADRETPAEMEFSLPTAGLRGTQRYELSIIPAAGDAEYHGANNVYSQRFAVGRDGAAPELDVLFDGMEIVDNDYVSPTPVIEIALRDASALPVTDTSAVQLFLDGRRVWLASDPAVRLTTGTGEEKVHVEYTPTLDDGLHFLAVSGKDATGNAADTIPYQVRFYVSREQRVDQVLPYPSPTTGPVDFTFRVTGTDAPERAQVKIYTVAGRLIRVVEADPAALRVGFNRIAWEGRDEDGDAPANGVYFYKLVVRARDGSQTEITGRFAVLR